MAVWQDRSLMVSPIYYGLVTSHSLLAKELKKLGKPELIHTHEFLDKGSGATTNFMENENGEMAAIVCLFEHKHDKEQIFSLLVHEAVHIWQEIKKEMREENPSLEFEAYSIQRISQNLFYEFKKQTKKENKMAKKKVKVVKKASKPVKK